MLNYSVLGEKADMFCHGIMGSGDQRTTRSLRCSSECDCTYCLRNHDAVRWGSPHSCLCKDLVALEQGGTPNIVMDTLWWKVALDCASLCPEADVDA